MVQKVTPWHVWTESTLKTPTLHCHPPTQPVFLSWCQHVGPWCLIVGSRCRWQRCPPSPRAALHRIVLASGKVGLAKSLAAGVGDELVILSSTIHGDQSSTLVHVRGLIRIKDNPQAEQSVLLGGLSDEIRVDLLDSGAGTTELVVRRDAEQNVAQVVDSLNRSFASQGAPWIAEAWYSNRELSFLTAIFNGIGVTVTIILSLIVSFIISNAMLMSIFERIREVGSIRAIGADKRQIYGLFYLEYP